MTSLFLFGAGASFGSGPCTPHPPPLGTSLFSSLQAEGGIAATVGCDLAATFAQDFEAGMDQFWAERNTQITALLRDMACYFARFEPRPGNLYLELIRVLGGTKKRAIFATTNYDLLIEHALAMSGLNATYGAPSDGRPNVPVLKIHGSCNFLPTTESHQLSNLSFDLSHSPRDAVAVEAPVRIAASTLEIVRFCQNENSLAPALALYSPSKQILYCKKFVEAQQRAWLATLSTVARIYVIGLRVHLIDKHIWEPLSKARAPIYYVGREPDEFLEWARNAKRKSAFSLSDSFDKAISLIANQLNYRR